MSCSWASPCPLERICSYVRQDDAGVAEKWRHYACRVGEAGDIDAAKPVKEGLEAVHASALLAAAEARPGDLLLLAAGPEATVNKCVRVRVRVRDGSDC